MSLENPDPPLVSPFPPIADYGFLSDCETCALVAPSGAIEWMCLPRYDGPSVFGALLDRDAGTFRLGPADTMVPAARRYLPGHDDPRDLVGHEPRLGDRPRRAARRPVARHRRALDARTAARPPTTTPTTSCCARCAASTARVEVQLECDPIFDYGRRYAHWEYVGDGYSEAVATAEGWPTKLTLTTDLRVGFEGSRVRALTTLHDGDTAFVALAFSEHAGPKTYARGLRPPGQDRRLLAPVARPRHVPGPPVAPVPAAQRADAEGPHLLADRRDDRRRDDVAARDPGRRAQLGLPLLLGARQHVHALGPALARLRVGGQRLLLLHAGRRPGRRPAGDVRHPGRARADRGHARPPLAATTTPAPCGSATAPTTSASTTCGARCWTRSSCTPSRATTCPSAAGR